MEPQGFHRSRYVPPGRYKARYVRIEGQKYGSISKIVFEIVDGDYAGFEVIGISKQISNRENKLSEIVWAHVPTPDQPDPKQYIGIGYAIRVDHLPWFKTSRVVSAELA